MEGSFDLSRLIERHQEIARSKEIRSNPHLVIKAVARKRRVRDPKTVTQTTNSRLIPVEESLGRFIDTLKHLFTVNYSVSVPLQLYKIES